MDFSLFNRPVSTEVEGMVVSLRERWACANRRIVAVGRGLPLDTETVGSLDRALERLNLLHLKDELAKMGLM